MSFLEFISKIFQAFHTVLKNISKYFNMLTENNFIKLSLYIGITIFLITLIFEIINLLPRIFKLKNKEEDKELINFEKEMRRKRMQEYKSRNR